jgi:predicted DNA-binding transcriptional regulator AlpA
MLSTDAAKLDGAAAHANPSQPWVLSEKEAARLCGLSLVHFRRLRQAGKAPRAIRLSERRIGYRACEVRAWLDAREAA